MSFIALKAVGSMPVTSRLVIACSVMLGAGALTVQDTVTQCVQKAMVVI